MLRSLKVMLFTYGLQGGRYENRKTPQTTANYRKPSPALPYLFTANYRKLPQTTANLVQPYLTCLPQTTANYRKLPQT